MAAALTEATKTKTMATSAKTRVEMDCMMGGWMDVYVWASVCRRRDGCRVRGGGHNDGARLGLYTLAQNPRERRRSHGPSAPIASPSHRTKEVRRPRAASPNLGIALPRGLFTSMSFL